MMKMSCNFLKSVENLKALEVKRRNGMKVEVLRYFLAYNRKSVEGDEVN